ncbi:hypothetical protein [Paragemmobacter ruber]|uniref:DUF4412 domain-containing protein n=1 Tax=Paragemmobacter ruber TaxID=1985673 RepID=A0ABW9Y8E2_9RHOB|nr:hypothetical protein [Rhodobacter ruber]NBE08089.1 hypothetical protein [Rhodobacter ruber]
MWRIFLLWLVSAGVGWAAETLERGKPVFAMDRSSPLRAFHLPGGLDPGGRLLRVQVNSGFVDVPTDETYVIVSHADGRAPVFRFEARQMNMWGKMQRRRGGERTLTEAETARLRSVVAEIGICGATAEKGDVVDTGSFQLEFVNEDRYCHLSRLHDAPIEVDWRIVDLLAEFAWGEDPGYDDLAASVP